MSQRCKCRTSRLSCRHYICLHSLRRPRGARRRQLLSPDSPDPPIHNLQTSQDLSQGFFQRLSLEALDLHHRRFVRSSRSPRSKPSPHRPWHARPISILTEEGSQSFLDAPDEQSPNRVFGPQHSLHRSSQLTLVRLRGGRIPRLGQQDEREVLEMGVGGRGGRVEIREEEGVELAC